MVKQWVNTKYFFMIKSFCSSVALKVSGGTFYDKQYLKRYFWSVKVFLWKCMNLFVYCNKVGMALLLMHFNVVALAH